MTEQRREEPIPVEQPESQARPVSTGTLSADSLSEGPASQSSAVTAARVTKDASLDESKETGCEAKAHGGTEASDTGTQIAMRILLGIVAGLLISDMLKICVRAIIGDGWTCCPALIEATLSIAALLFIGRVVIDNVLHYHEADWVLKSQAYWLRWFLVSLDLLSYSFCYGTVALFDIANARGVVTCWTVVWSLAALTAVELLHWLWCVCAIALAREGGICSTDSRVLALIVWCRASLGCASVGVALLTVFSYTISDGPVTRSAAAAFTTFCAGSVGLYLFARRTEYLRRRAK